MRLATIRELLTSGNLLSTDHSLLSSLTTDHSLLASKREILTFNEFMVI